MLRELGITSKNTELARMIRDNPDLPLVISCSNEDCIEDGSYTFMSSCTAYITEILDCQTIVHDRNKNELIEIFDDRFSFKERLIETLEDEERYEHMSDEEFDAVVDKYMAEYEPYWKKVIIIHACN